MKSRFPEVIELQINLHIVECVWWHLNKDNLMAVKNASVWFIQTQSLPHFHRQRQTFQSVRVLKADPFSTFGEYNHALTMYNSPARPNAMN